MIEYYKDKYEVTKSKLFDLTQHYDELQSELFALREQVNQLMLNNYALISDNQKLRIKNDYYKIRIKQLQTRVSNLSQFLSRRKV